MFRSHYFPKTRFYIFAFALGILFMLSGCKSAQLKELEALASSIQPPMGQEVSRISRDTSPAITGFGPTPAKIYIEYGPINNHTKEELYDEIVTILEENGGEGRVCDACSSVSFFADLPRGDSPGSIKTIIIIHPDKNLVSISMQHPTR